MKLLLSELRQLIREEFESAYNDYQASQDTIMRRIRQVTSDEVKTRYPKFYQAIADNMHKNEDHDGLLKIQWYFMKGTYNKDVPYALMPSEGKRLPDEEANSEFPVVYWDMNTDSLKSADSSDLYYALSRLGDKTSTF